MLQRPISDRDDLPWFEVTGWHDDRAAKLCVESRAELDFWRRVIAYERTTVESRLDAVEARADKRSTKYRKAEHLKSPAPFDLTVRSIEAPVVERMDRCEGGPKVLSRAALEGSWFAELGKNGLKSRSLLAIGCRDKEPLLSSVPPDVEILHLAAGEGRVEPALSGLEDRHRAEASSFAGWLQATQPAKRKAIDALILGKEASDLDIEGLRHRLFPHQCVVADGSTTIGKALLQAWDGKIEAVHDGVIFKRPGPGFLDPGAGEPEIDWPKISVVTVSYNQADFLEDCLCSVLDQNYPNLDYIVIDAVSTDGSIDILRRYEHRLSRLVIEPDSGQSEGLNKGLDLATGEILTWINSDDMLAPGALRRAALAFRRFGADMVTGGCERISENSDRVLFSHHAALPFFKPVPLGFGENLMWTGAWEQGDYVFQPEVMFTREIWNRAGGYLKQHLYWAMDWELWLRMAMAGATVVNIPEIVGRSRQQDNQKTTEDELYLFQIRNILVEHDQALATLDKQATALPQGQPRSWMPNQAMKRSVPVNADLLQRLWRLRHPRRLWQALSKRLPASVTSKVLRVKRRLLYGWAMPRLVSGRTYARFARSNQLLTDIDAETKQARRDHQALLAERDLLQQHCEDLKAVIQERFAKQQEAAKTDAADAIADFLMTMLFDGDAAPADRTLVRTLLVRGEPVQEMARTLAIQHFSRQSVPSFDLARPYLRRHRAFPDEPDLREQLGTFSIVDVGSEALAFESDIYAELIARWPAVILGFDPFDDGEQPDGRQTGRNPDVRMRSMKAFVGTGKPATFHVNRMRATSSLFASNQDLASKFSLLGEALETTDRQPVETARLDDLLKGDPDFKDGIDFLKVDVQGGSLEVLEGAEACLAKTLVCHVEAEFTDLYKNECVFADIDAFMRAQGFALLDFARLGRQRYKSFDRSPTYFFEAGRVLWADCLYVRHLDRMEELGPQDLLKLAVICHEIYRKPDCAVEALGHHDAKSGDSLSERFIRSQDPDQVVDEVVAMSSGRVT